MVKATMHPTRTHGLMKIMFRIIMISVLIVLALAGMVYAEQPINQIVKAQGYFSTSALMPGSSFKIAVVLDIKEGYHIGAAVETAGWPSKLKLSGPKYLTFDPPKYPKETLRADSFSDGEKIPVYEGKITIFVDGKVSKKAVPGKCSITATFAYQGCSETECLMPQEVVVTLNTKIAKPGEHPKAINDDIFGAKTEKTTEKEATSLFKSGILIGLAGIFGLGFLLSLTPCVYPMIPITIGFFGAQTEKKTGRLVFLAGLYVLGLAVTYSMLGVVAAMTGGILGSALQNPYVPLGLAIVLVALALSMFGVYEFRVPAFIAGRSQGKQGPLGALLMGLLFGVAAAPCVGPVTVGISLQIAKSGNPYLGFLTFFVLALGIGTPLFFLAIFSGAINRIPRAGMWMVSIKKVFGFLLLGAAIYYAAPMIGMISKRAADLALPVFIAISGIYFGFFEKSLGRRLIIRLAIGIGIILLGAWMAWPTAAPMEFETYSANAIARATKQNNPVLIDFSATFCLACNELEHKTFTDKQIKAEGERFVRLKAILDMDKTPKIEALRKHYKVSGSPTLVFLDSSGNEVKEARTIGYVNARTLIKKMRMVK